MKLLHIGGIIANLGVIILAVGVLRIQQTSITTSQKEKRLTVLLLASIIIISVGIIVQLGALFI